jgi:hypothetical protein
MKNGLFKLYSSDYVKGLVTAIFSAVITYVYYIVIVNGFSFFGVDYTQLFHDVVNVAGITFISYLAKNFFTTSKGSLLGVTPEIK